jgi:hypothetical protein
MNAFISRDYPGADHCNTNVQKGNAMRVYVIAQCLRVALFFSLMGIIGAQPHTDSGDIRGTWSATADGVTRTGNN